MYNNVQRHPHTEWNVRRGFVHWRLSQNEHHHRKQAVYPKRPDLNSPTAGKHNENPSRIFFCWIKQNNRIIKIVDFSLKKRGLKICFFTCKVSLQFLINTVNLDASSGAPPVFVNDTPPAGSALEVKLPQTISISFYAYSNQT